MVGRPGLRKRIGAHARTNVVAYLALFVALGGTSAYAANTIGSSDVIDGSLVGADVDNGSLVRGDFATSTLTGTPFLDESLSFHDLAAGTIVNSRIADNAVNSAKVDDDSLRGEDIDESGFQHARVMTRARQTAPVSSAATGFADIPLSDDTWTQPASQLNQLAVSATVTAPAQCLVGGFEASFPTGTVSVFAGGNSFSIAQVRHGTGTQTVHLNIPALLGPDAAANKVVDAFITDSCDGETDGYSVSNMKIDVTGVR